MSQPAFSDNPPEFETECRTCGEDIDMVQDEEGKWHPYDRGSADEHVCNRDAMLDSLPKLS